ncbi:Molybdopterin synthase catalytic subunit [Rubripirellula lacrimiformis]|uniref:Molybdopterin synthase catalytic subunit n=1 Tax=Rubripirellula lacrimiformis TaxID=1930273 RepID=A0A517NJL1_9BACT|nr:molybdenum cofactor biosynthesis protein MoaE [Rubripirellula lacrimiformis]QDT07223.1 Molybdopterin synthase catalytic subunit [Rubripirellula lacrimiformis]
MNREPNDSRQESFDRPGHWRHIELVDGPIDIAALTTRLGDPDVGAHGWFIGVTRRTTDQRITETLCYEAHREMAVSELQRLAEQAAEKFSLRQVIIVHRLGPVPVGQASIVVGCCSPHRVETFAALPWMMDVLKQDVPIWKQETYVDGSQQWVHPTDD